MNGMEWLHRCGRLQLSFTARLHCGAPAAARRVFNTAPQQPRLRSARRLQHSCRRQPRCSASAAAEQVALPGPLGVRLCVAAELRPGEFVVDLASGTGNAALEAAHRVGPGGRVVGVDLEDSMQARAQAKARAQELDNVHFQQGDIEEVDLPAGSVDCVMCCSGFAYLRDTPAALRRYHAWLRPGGRLCFNVLRAPSLPLSEVAFELAAKKLGVQLEDPGGALGRPDVIKAALKAAGFSTVKVETEEVSVLPKTTPQEYAADMFEYMEFYPPAPLFARLTEQQLEDLRAAFVPLATAKAQRMVYKEHIVRKFSMQWAVAAK